MHSYTRVVRKKEKEKREIKNRWNMYKIPNRTVDFNPILIITLSVNVLNTLVQRQSDSIQI